MTMINWRDPSEEDKEAFKIYNQVNNYLLSSGYSENVKSKFLYICAEHSELYTQFNILLKKYRELQSKATDKRVKFTDYQKRHIIEVYNTKGKKSVRKTKGILSKEGIDISERYLYKLIGGK